MPNSKNDQLVIRIDPETAQRAKDKAAAYGGISVVIRALLRQWLEGGRALTAEDILREHNRAPKSPKKKAR